MQTIKLNEENFQLINSLEELKIKDFKQVLDIVQDDNLSEVEKQVRLLNLLSNNAITEDQVMDLDLEVFEELVSIINVDNADYPIEPIYNLGGVVYKLKGDFQNFKFTVNQMLNIQKAMGTDINDYIHHMMGFLYQNPNYSARERAESFKEHMTMDYVSPFLNLLLAKYGS